MMFDLDAIADEEERVPFEFTLNGAVWRVPHVADLEVGQQMAIDAGELAFAVRRIGDRVRRLGEFDDDGNEVETPDPDGLAEALLGLRPAKTGKLLAAWLAHGALKPGESAASPLSSARTARPLTRTSRRSTA